jgi:hypothetical protein
LFRGLVRLLLLAPLAWALARAASVAGPEVAAQTQTQEPKASPPATLTAPTTITTPLPVPADFKLTITFQGVRKEPITRAELLFHGGDAYYFASEAPEEVVTVNPSGTRLEFLDLDRGVQSEIMFTRLDQKQAVLHGALVQAIQKHDESGTRADRVAAAMSRALVEPALAETYDPAAHHLKLTNSAVTVDATGEPEPDVGRLALIDLALTRLIQLAAVRHPEAIPPFIRLDALHALTARRQLRPNELSFVYRLTGPPRKHAWRYALVNTLTDRELEGLKRVAGVRARSRFIPFERYERRGAERKGAKPGDSR